MLEESHATHCDGGSGRKLLPRQDITPLPCPLRSWKPPLESGLGSAGTPPWLCLLCLCGQDLPCRSGEFLLTMWPKPVTSVPLSFQTACCNSLCWAQWPAAPQTFLDPACHLQTPRPSLLLVCKKRICRERSVSVTLFCPLCVPLHLQHPAGLPKPSPFHLQSRGRKALSESGDSVLPRESEKDR